MRRLRAAHPFVEQAMGLPIWLDAEDPLDPAARLQRLVVAQDTGGAIRGPVRADLFFGFGPDAGSQAGMMKYDGEMWLLWPKGFVPTTP